MPCGYGIWYGGTLGSVSGTADPNYVPELTVNDTLWVRVESNGSAVTVKCREDSSNWDGTTPCYTSSSFATHGGFLGFGSGQNVDVDDLTVNAYVGDSWVTQVWDGFTVDADGDFADDLQHDAAGNLEYDGLYKYTYDAWNRLVKVERPYLDSSDDLTAGSEVASMDYDGLGRRISKEIKNSADWSATYHYYYDGQRMIETRNGSDQVLKSR